MTTYVEPNEDAPFTLYPNPARDYVKIGLHHSALHGLNVDVFNPQGQRLLTEYFEQPGSEILLHTGLLPPGMYVIQLSNEEVDWYAKLIIKK